MAQTNTIKPPEAVAHLQQHDEVWQPPNGVVELEARVARYGVRFGDLGEAS